MSNMSLNWVTNSGHAWSSGFDASVKHIRLIARGGFEEVHEVKYTINQHLGRDSLTDFRCRISNLALYEPISFSSLDNVLTSGFARKFIPRGTRDGEIRNELWAVAKLCQPLGTPEYCFSLSNGGISLFIFLSGHGAVRFESTCLDSK